MTMTKTSPWSGGIQMQRTGTYNVVLNAYCGMSVPVARDVDREEAIAAIKRFLNRARRNGCPVAKLGKGQWEIQTPDDAALVSDLEGILRVRPCYRRYRNILGRRVYLD